MKQNRESKKVKKEKKVVKGMPTAVLISILIHTGLFLLAGMFVVFTVVKQKEVEFEPPKAVERPKMKLKKPKVKVKKSSKPKPTTRIVTKVQKASMPDIQLPEMSGMTEGLAGGIGGGFDLMPNLDEIGVFGSGQSVGNDFVGTFYDFKRNRKGTPLGAGMDPDKYMQELMRFLRNDWKPSVWSRYYRSPKKLYATTIMIPAILSTQAPAAFGEPETGGWCWAVHYTGQLVYPEDITFRFWGFGDDEMFVRVDGELVLVACWKSDSGNSSDAYFSPLWKSTSADSRRYYLGNNLSVVGDWITLKAGEPVDMEVLIGEKPGGAYCAMLLVEVEGVEYPRNRQGGPILPIFKTAYPSLDLQDAIYKDHVPDEACVTNGPIFSDYDTSARTITNQEVAVEAPATNAAPEEADDGMRTWTFANGEKLEAEFITVIGGKVVLKNSRGKQKKIPMDQLSEEDRRYVELIQPPVFNIDFAKKTSQRSDPPSPWSSRIPPTLFDYIFKAKLKQVSTGDYNHELQVELFAIGQEHMGDKFILLARKKTSFVPAEENRSFAFETDEKVTIYTDDLYGDVRGTDYYGYLIVVTDERGKIIQHAESNKWLFEALDNLRKLPVGRYMDKTGKRVFPTSPRPTKY